MTCAIAGKGSCPARKRSTATSFAAFNTAPPTPPSRAASSASASAGKRSVSGCSNARPASAVRSSAPTPASRRSGHARACAMGVRMSAWPSSASTEPSTYCTSECTTLCGWTTTSTCSGAAANSQQASMTSRPLFIIVAESTEILRPMAQLGWAQASSGVTAASVSGARRKNGPPEPVSRMRSTPSPASPFGRAGGRHWKMALCSLSMGSSVAPPARAAAITRPPAMTRASLLASRMRLPARAAASVEVSPAAPTMAAMTASTAAAAAAFSRPSRPASTRVARPWASTRRASSCAASASLMTAYSGCSVRTCCQSASTWRCALSATTAKRCGWRAKTSSVLAPIEPVEPRTATPTRP